MYLSVTHAIHAMSIRQWVQYNVIITCLIWKYKNEVVE